MAMASGATILLADDDVTVREALRGLLEDEGYQLTVVEDGAQAIAALDQHEFDLVISDLQMPNVDGLGLLRAVRQQSPQSIFVLMTAHATVESAIAALHEGASEYLLKPVIFDDVLHKLDTLLTNRQLSWERQFLRRQLDCRWDYEKLIGTSAVMREVAELIQRVAPTPSSVLISGESGTGKEVVARNIHALSEYRDRIFLPVNCGAIAETLLESQLFGHLRGAFTGAVATQEGLFQQARGGTLFLDEIGDLPFGLQVKLLRAIETKEVIPVGASKPVRVDFRLIAATNRDLKKDVEERRFREDLYYRLHVVAIDLPPLRERREDIPALIEHLVQVCNRDLKRNVKGVDATTVRLLSGLPWKGNVRELRNVIEHAMILGDGDWITVANLPRELRGAETSLYPDDLRQAMHLAERQHIDRVLARHSNDKRAAAQSLGISLSSLYRKLEEVPESDTSTVLS